MKQIFICSTLYQVIVAIHMKFVWYENDSTHLVITDSISNVEQLARLLADTRVFQSVSYLAGKGTIIEFPKHLFFNPRYDKVLRAHIHCSGDYDILDKNSFDQIFFANIGGSSLCLATYLKKKSKNAEVNMFEEGVSSYSNYYGNAIHKKCNLRYLYKNWLMGILRKINHFYYFHPEILVWDPVAQVVQIPSLSSTHNRLKNCLNSIFQYHKLTDSYIEKVIFFEESYYGDGIKTNDMEIIGKLTDKYGKEDVFIKTHPRNGTDRFGKIGYHTNINTSVPWEVIALNIDLHGKILATMTSTAVVNSFLLLNAPAVFVMEYSRLSETFTNARVVYTIEVIEKIKSMYPSVFKEIKDL